jgi:serine/threonine protein kinase
MGQVFLAYDRKVDREVALKFIAPDLKTDPDAIHRFEREGRAAARVSHPNVVAVHTIEYVEGEPFIVYEYIPGETLSVIGQSLTLNERCSALLQVANGLDSIHSGGVIHRDIKSENVILRPDHRAVIVDFGVGKFFEIGANTRTQLAITREQHAPGTLQYMAPEVLENKDVGPSSDIFSYGVLAYELLTGKRPFDHPTVAATFAAILRDSAASLRSIASDIPKELDDIVVKCLDKNPSARPSLTDLQFVFGAAHIQPRVAQRNAIEAAVNLESESPRFANPVSTPDGWFDSHADRARELARSVGHATIEFRVRVNGDMKRLSVAKLHRALKSVQVDTDVSYVGRVIDDDRYRATPAAGEIQATIQFEHSRSLWYWAVSTSGDLYSLTVIPTEQQHIVRIESLLGPVIFHLFYIKELERALHGVAPIALAIETELRGIEGTTVTSGNRMRAFTNDLFFAPRLSRVDHAQAQTQVSVVDLSDAFGDVVASLFDDLIAYFDYLMVPTDYYDYFITGFRKSHDL